jgi:hypothetical protein
MAGDRSVIVQLLEVQGVVLGLKSLELKGPSSQRARACRPLMLFCALAADTVDDAPESVDQTLVYLHRPLVGVFTTWRWTAWRCGGAAGRPSRVK